MDIERVRFGPESLRPIIKFFFKSGKYPVDSRTISVYSDQTIGKIRTSCRVWTMALTLTQTLLHSTSPEHARVSTSDAIRLRALERLYERKAAVDELIESLEEYQRCRNRQRAQCVALTAAPRYS
jgi:hypothetical protein